MTEEELPSGWAMATLGDVCIGAEQVNPADVFPSEFRYLEISSIDNRHHQFVDPSLVDVAEAPSRARQLVRAGDTLFSTVRTNLKNIALISQEYDGQICSTGFSVLRPKSNIEHRYIFYFAVSQAFVDRVSALQRGVSYPAVRDADVRAQAIPVAPLNEQRRIVERIDELFSQIEAGEAALARARKLLGRYRQAVLEAAVTGELTRDWRERHKAEIEPADQLLARILQARREAWEKAELEKLRAKGKEPKDDKWKSKYKEPVPPDTTDMPKVPEGWVWEPLDIAFLLERGRFSVRPRNDPTCYGGDYPFVQIGDLPRNGGKIAAYKQTLNAKGYSVSRKFPSGTILIAIVGATIANTGILTFESCTPDSIVAIQSSHKVLLRFLEMAFSLRKDNIRNAAYASGGQPNINLETLRPLSFALPPENECTEIMERVEEMRSVLEHCESEIEASRLHAATLRQAILTAAFAGKLVPQDPADEPAAALLDRIRAERPATAATKPRRGRPPPRSVARGAVGGDLPLFSGHAAVGGDRR